MAGWRVQAGLNVLVLPSLARATRNPVMPQALFITGGSLEQWSKRFGDVKLRAAASSSSSGSSSSSSSTSDPGVTRLFPKH